MRVAADVQRRLYYGWVVVGTLATTETISWGILYYTFAAFLVPMRQELGWSTATLTGAYSLALLVSGLAAVPVGRWVGRAHYGAIGGALALFVSGAAALAPVGAGVAHEFVGRYGTVFAALAAISLLAALAMLGMLRWG